MTMAGCRDTFLTLLWLQTMLGGGRGQGTVSWDMGMFGVNEDEPSVEVCATYSEAVEGFTVETSTTDITATDGVDYQSQIGTEAQLRWAANTTRACITIPIIDDLIVENDEVVFLNMVRIVMSPSSAVPSLASPSMLFIMDNDVIQLVFTSGDITLTDDVGSTEVCVGVSDEQVDEGVSYRIPIMAETVGGTAVPDEDFEPFNNVTVGTADQAVLTPFRPSHCFTIALLARPDDGLDDRSFFVALSVREGSNNIEPSPDRIRAPSADLQVTIQPSAQIEVGDIVDSVLTNPVFSVLLDIEGAESDSNLCYEVNGESGNFFNLVSDLCFSINAHYEAIEGATDLNKIEELSITTFDAADECNSIVISAQEDCKSAILLRGTQAEIVTRRYRRNGIQIDFVDGSTIEVLLPCKTYPGGGVRVVVMCQENFESLPVKNLQVAFNRAKLPASSQSFPHGLLGQFWHLGFTQQEFTAPFRNDQTRDNAVEVSTPPELGSSTFVCLSHPVTWDHRNEICLYAGSHQGGASNYVTSPAGSIIEGDYTDYKVAGLLASEYKFSIFEAVNCPSNT